MKCIAMSYRQLSRASGAIEEIHDDDDDAYAEE